MKSAYKHLKLDLRDELSNILDYWTKNTVDIEHGGFFGRIDHYNVVVPNASKGIILNTRILWSFSAAANHLGTREYTNICETSFLYIRDFFYDKTHKGVFWELDCTGKPINKRKQVYAQAFAIYALSAYYSFSKNQEAKDLAIVLFELVEKYSKDSLKGGYFEAFDEKWNSLEDMRLSDKDMNASKTMNTHLHILEAYTSLLKIYDSNELRASLSLLVHLFLETFLNDKNHFDLFFDKDWNLLSSVVSYGHDIETAWLVIEAAKQIGEERLLKRWEAMAIKVADTFLQEAIDSDGAVINEKNLNTNVIDSDRHWWPQTEALIGLDYVYRLTGDEKYLKYALRIWDFTKNHLIDSKNGEWHFRVDQNGKVNTTEDKVSMWKAPYHSSRACIILNNIP